MQHHSCLNKHKVVSKLFPMFNCARLHSLLAVVRDFWCTLAQVRHPPDTFPAGIYLVVFNRCFAHPYKSTDDTSCTLQILVQ